jgi:hypothetical protein
MYVCERDVVDKVLSAWCGVGQGNLLLVVLIGVRVWA